MAPKDKKWVYTQEDLDNAIDAYKAGASSRFVSQKYRIPKTTILDRAQGKVPQECKKGPQTFLTSAEEELLVAFVANAQKRALPVTNETIVSLVSSILATEQEMPKEQLVPRPDCYEFGKEGTEHQPGRTWLRLFKKRHPNIVPRTSEALPRARKAVTKSSIEQWFATCQDYFVDEGPDFEDALNQPARNFNIDESGFSLCPKAKIVLAIRGSKTVSTETSGKEKSNITVLGEYVLFRSKCSLLEF